MLTFTKMLPTTVISRYLTNGLIRSNFFSRHVIDTWNRLPEEVVDRYLPNSLTTNTIKATWISALHS